MLLNLASHAGQAQAGSIIVTLATLGAALLVRRLDKRKPYMLAGLAAGTMAAAAWNAWGGAGVPVLGAIAQPWPPFHVPSVDWRALPDLLSLAFALTIVALAQSISIAKAVAARSGQRIDANREFMGQGLSNIVGGFFSCYLSCGSLNRSVPNFEAGARTPLAAVFSALLLVALVALSAPLLALIPHAAIAGLLLLVAWTLLDTPRWRRLLATQRGGGDRGGDPGGHRDDTDGSGDPAGHGAVADGLSAPHVAARHAHHGLRRARAEPPLRRDGAAAAARGLPECPQLKLLRMGARCISARPRTRSGCTNCARRTRRVICWSWPRA